MLVLNYNNLQISYASTNVLFACCMYNILDISTMFVALPGLSGYLVEKHLRSIVIIVRLTAYVIMFECEHSDQCSV